MRERKEDIPLLIRNIIEEENETNKKVKRITQEALNKLLTYNYPGNIRELENIIKRAYIFSDNNEIKDEDIELEASIKDRNSMSSIFPEILYKKLEQGADYWQIVHEPFKRNELSKDQVWEIICLALKNAPKKKFKEAVTKLNIKENEYKRFLNMKRIYDRRKNKRR